MDKAPDPISPDSPALREWRRPRVVHAVSQMDIGGVQRLLIECVAHQRETGLFSRVLLLTHKPGRWEDSFRALDAPVERLPRRSFPWLTFSKCLFDAWRLSRRLRAWNTRVLHIHQPKPSLFLVLAGRMARVPCVVIHLHSVYTDHYWSKLSPKRMAWERWVGRRADAFIAVSAPVAEAGAKALSAPLEKFHVVHNGVGALDACALERARAGTAGLPAIPEGWRVIGGVGRLIPDKRWEDFLDAAALVLKERARVQFWIVGGDEANQSFSKTLKDRAQRLGLGGHVHFLGTRTDIPPIIARMDAGVLCSSREGCPIVLLEFMSAGVPCVVSDTPAILEMVRHEETGLVSRVGDVADMAANMLRVLTDKALRDRLTTAGLRQAREWSWERMASRVVDLYRGVLRSKGQDLDVADLDRTEKPPRAAAQVSELEEGGILFFLDAVSDADEELRSDALQLAQAVAASGRRVKFAGRGRLKSAPGIPFERLKAPTMGEWNSPAGRAFLREYFARQRAEGWETIYATDPALVGTLHAATREAGLRLVVEIREPRSRTELRRRLSLLGEYAPTPSIFRELAAICRAEERELAERADGIVCASGILRGRMERKGARVLGVAERSAPREEWARQVVELLVNASKSSPAKRPQSQPSSSGR